MWVLCIQTQVLILCGKHFTDWAISFALAPIYFLFSLWQFCIWIHYVLIISTPSLPHYKSPQAPQDTSPSCSLSLFVVMQNRIVWEVGLKSFFLVHFFPILVPPTIENIWRGSELGELSHMWNLLSLQYINVNILEGFHCNGVMGEAQGWVAETCLMVHVWPSGYLVGVVSFYLFFI